jgi:hypothetical protein
MPLFFFMLTFVGLTYVQLRRVKDFDPANREIGKLWPLTADLPRDFSYLKQRVESLEFRLENSWRPHPPRNTRKLASLIVLLVAGAFLVVPAVRDFTHSSLDQSWHGWISLIFYIAAVAVIASHLWWLHELWARLRDLLLELVHLPMLDAFDRVPPALSRWASGGLLGWQRSNYRAILRMIEQQFASLGFAVPRHEPHNPPKWEPLLNRLTEQLPAHAAHWHNKPLAEAYPPFDPGAKSAPPKELPSGATLNTPQFELLLAAMLFTYTIPFLVQLRRLALVVTIATGALILAAWSYPYAPSSNLRASAWILALIAAVIIVRIANQINADEIISRVVGTAPNKVTWDADYVMTILKYLLPLILLVLYSIFGLPPEVVNWFGRLVGR